VIEVRRAYTKPELIQRGTIAEVTQGIGSLGSGDMIFQFLQKEGWPTGPFTDGCGPNHQWLCTGS
jgi:hypothetical protein